MAVSLQILLRPGEDCQNIRYEASPCEEVGRHVCYAAVLCGVAYPALHRRQDADSLATETGL